MLALDLVEHQRGFLVTTAVEAALAQRVERADVTGNVGGVGARLRSARAAGEERNGGKRGESGQAIQAILHSRVLAEAEGTGKPLPLRAKGG